MARSVTNSPDLSLQHAVGVVHNALEQGGGVRIGKEGALEVTGRTFFGRLVRYLKTRFLPDKARKQNHAVLEALNQAIGEEFGTQHQLQIAQVLDNARSRKSLLQSMLNSVRDIRASCPYVPANSTKEEMRNARKFGFAGSIVAPKFMHEQLTTVTGPLNREPSMVKEQLFWYNRTLADLHRRFPKLRNVPAISALSLGRPPPTGANEIARYIFRKRSMRLSLFWPEYMSSVVSRQTRTGFSTPKQDYGGLVQHEYAHHLSMRVVPMRRWVPKLVRALKDGGMAQARIKTNIPGKPCFDKATEKYVAATIGRYASTDALECAAEILAWYMNPEYGETVRPMPKYLEHWVRECFPMLVTD